MINLHRLDTKTLLLQATLWDVFINLSPRKLITFLQHYHMGYKVCRLL